jgi:protein-disulfide isomerase
VRCCPALKALPISAFLLMPLWSQGPLVEGNAQSEVRVVIYEDLQCPDCAAFRHMLDEKLLPKYAARVAFEHRDFPLAKHSWARPASVASRWFQQIRPELAVAFRRETMAQLRTIKAGTLEDHVAAFAKRNGLKPEDALAGMRDEQLAALVEKDFQGGVARGIARTPTAMVNGEPFIETFTLEEISAAIDRELKGSTQK